MKKVIPLIVWCVTFALLTLWLSFINLDATPQRLFVMYWPIYVGGIAGAIVLFVLAMKK